MIIEPSLGDINLTTCPSLIALLKQGNSCIGLSETLLNLSFNHTSSLLQLLRIDKTVGESTFSTL